MSRPLTLPEAIAKIEGFGVNPNNRPTRNRNPGDIEMHDWLKVPPYNATMERVQPTVTPRFACFPTNDLGWLALRHLLLGPHYADLTIEQAINKYAPPEENNTVNYVAQVCKEVGCKPTDTVREVMIKA